MCGPRGAWRVTRSIRLLLELAKQPGVRLYGINYKDDMARRRGASSAATAILSPGSAPTAPAASAIDFGVYGVPETYVMTGDGKIAYRHVGPLTETPSGTSCCRCVQPSGEKPQG